MTPAAPPPCPALCPVDAAALAAWAAFLSPGAWHRPAYATDPQRVFDVPAGLLAPVTSAVLALYPAGTRVTGAMLSRMKPGQAHPPHVDQQGELWLTRVHVPLLTNPGAWFAFDGPRFHLAAGFAYAFDTRRLHSFGNDGDADRVHLIFDLERPR